MTNLALPPLVLRGVVFAPPLFSAPMAGVTHSAFRRLLSDFGGYGALYSEMLSGKYLLHEDLGRSPWLKRRAAEGRVIYQLLMADDDRLPEIAARLRLLAPDAIDLNLACNALPVRKQRGGSSLFGDMARMRTILRGLRAHFAGPLLVKIRLGDEGDGWPERLRERLQAVRGRGRGRGGRARALPRREAGPARPTVALPRLGRANALAHHRQRRPQRPRLSSLATPSHCPPRAA